jgi:hypothetical protein
MTRDQSIGPSVEGARVEAARIFARAIKVRAAWDKTFKNRRLLICRRASPCGARPRKQNKHMCIKHSGIKIRGHDGHS